MPHTIAARQDIQLLAFIGESPQKLVFVLVAWRMHNPVRQVLVTMSLTEGEAATLPPYPFELVIKQRGVAVTKKTADSGAERSAPLDAHHNFDFISARLLVHNCERWSVQQIAFSLTHLRDSSKPLAYITAAAQASRHIWHSAYTVLMMGQQFNMDNAFSNSCLSLDHKSGNISSEGYISCVGSSVCDSGA
jgi:hypothetical protein